MSILGFEANGGRSRPLLLRIGTRDLSSCHGRLPRPIEDGFVYHALNRGNNRADILKQASDHGASGLGSQVSIWLWPPLA
jgi:hypothetical protein